MLCWCSGAHIAWCGGHHVVDQAVGGVDRSRGWCEQSLGPAAVGAGYEGLVVVAVRAGGPTRRCWGAREW